MVSRITTTIFDDITGDEGATTQTFSIGSATYEIDLVENGAAIQLALAPFIEAGKKVTANRAPQRTTGGQVRVRDAHNAEVRAWATSQGLTVSTRGRISQAVFEAYEKAHA